MVAPTGLMPETVLRNYVHAKDENRPDMLERVFEAGAELVVVDHHVVSCSHGWPRGNHRRPRSELLGKRTRTFIPSICVARKPRPRRFPVAIKNQAMQLLPSAELAAILAWAQALNYPWCAVEKVARTSPSIELLAPVLQHLVA